MLLGSFSAVPWSPLCRAAGYVAAAPVPSQVLAMLSKLAPSSGQSVRTGRSSQAMRCMAGRAGTTPAPAAPNTSRQRAPRLSHVDGLGKKYEALLQQQGITTVEQLAERLLDRLARQQTTGAFTFLKEVGIRRQDHRQKVVDYIQKNFASGAWAQATAEAAAAAAAAAGPGRPFVTSPSMLTFCVEGNISAGKSTFLQYITEQRGVGREVLATDTKVVPEPVERWQDVAGPSGRLNLLKTFYDDPKRYAYPFQNYVFLTRVMAERDSAAADTGVRLMERSVFSDRMVFVRTVQESGWMGDVELAVYDSWFEPILNSQPSLLPDGFIYLRADPNVCMDRLKKRNRGGEDQITLEYLNGLHEKHEDWLWGGVRADDWLAKQAATGSSSSSDSAAHLVNRQVLERQQSGMYDSSSSSSSGGGSGSGSGLYLPQGYHHQQQQQQQGQPGLLVPNNIQGQLYFLQHSPALPQLLNGTPALVLDCNPDVLADDGLKGDFQDKVIDYIRFMKAYRKQQEEAGVSPRQRYGNAGSSSSSGVGVSRVPISPGAPACADMQQAVDSVQEVSRDTPGIRVVPANSGALEVTGGLEALTTATLGVLTGGDAAAAAGAGSSGKPSGALLTR